MYKINCDMNIIIRGSSDNFKKSLLNVINSKKENAVEILNKISSYKPTTKFGVVYYILKDIYYNEQLDYDFYILSKYNENDIDLFTFLNYLIKLDVNINNTK